MNNLCVMIISILMRTISLILCIRTIYGAVSEIEYNALYALYNATNGQNWVWHGSSSHWNFSFPGSSDPCEDQWQGVTCNPLKTHVTQIHLNLYNLVGKIPAELGSLSSLQYLFLSSNQLTGTIPAELGSLSSPQVSCR